MYFWHNFSDRKDFDKRWGVYLLYARRAKTIENTSSPIPREHFPF